MPHSVDPGHAPAASKATYEGRPDQGERTEMIAIDTQHGSGIRVSELTTTDLAEVLFCSSLQPSEVADPDTVRAAVAGSLRSHDGRVTACAEELAESYGKDPETTCRRMRWCRDLVGQVFTNVPAFG